MTANRIAGRRCRPHIPPERRILNYLRCEFSIPEKPVARARLYVASTNGFSGNDTLRMNLYHPRLNGRKVGEDFMNPGQLAPGQEMSKEYTVEIGSDWDVENVTVCALAYDNTGFVNNCLSCPITGTVDYQINN